MRHPKCGYFSPTRSKPWPWAQTVVIGIIVVLVLAVGVAGCGVDKPQLKAEVSPEVTAAIGALVNQSKTLDQKIERANDVITKIYNGDPWYVTLGEKAINVIGLAMALYLTQAGHGRFTNWNRNRPSRTPKVEGAGQQSIDPDGCCSGSHGGRAGDTDRGPGKTDDWNSISTR